MAPKFGTSGLRGLVAELTPALVADHIRAFVAACDTGTGLYVAHDLRPSSPDLARVVIDTARAEGLVVTDCGDVPTPALALAAMAAGAGSVMVTGSHIPADRNGLKFYLPSGEITKADEAAILGALGRGAGSGAGRGALGTLETDAGCGARWVARYVAAFGAEALDGLRVGVWAHTAVSRDLLVDAMRGLGADVVALGRRTGFVPVDTEAVPAAARQEIRDWVAEHRLDALVSTDGDGDRPLVADGRGEVVAGDVLGQITARVVGAETIVTPVTSNSGVEAGPARVLRTRVGSPYVIAGMEAAGGKVAGYEANGGFLLGFDAELGAGVLPRLVTRDSLLPIIAVLAAGRAAGGLAALVAAEPARFTAADRLEGVATAASAALVAALQADDVARSGFLAALGEMPAGLVLTDGLRMPCASGRVLHLRPSGNAPELRVYAEAESPQVAQGLLAKALALVRERLG